MDTLPNSTYYERCEAMLGQGRNQFVKTLVSVVLATLTLATFSNNALVIVALTWRRSRPSPFSLAMTLTASMVTADLLLSVSIMPLAVYNQVGESWILGKSTCRLFYTLDIFLCSVSLWHLGGLALDRYLAICRPFLHLRLTRPWKRALCAALWLLPFLIALPLFFLQWHEDETQESARCLKTLYESGRTCLWVPSHLHETVAPPLSILVPLLLVAAAHVPVIRASRAQSRRHRALWLRSPRGDPRKSRFPGGDPHKCRSPGGDPRQYQQAVVKDARPAPHYPGADALQTMGLHTADSNAEDTGRDGGTSGEGEDKKQPDSKRALTHGQDNMSIDRRKVKRVVLEGESENSDTNNPVSSETSVIGKEKPSLKYEGRYLDGTKDHTAVTEFNESYHREEGFQDKGIVGSNEDSPGRDSNPRMRQDCPEVKSLQQPDRPEVKSLQQPDRPEVKSLQQPDRPEVKSLQQPDRPEVKSLQQPDRPEVKSLQQPDRPEVKSLQQPDRPEVKSLQQPDRPEVKSLPLTPDCPSTRRQSREEDCPDAKRKRRERGEKHTDCPEAKRERYERREEQPDFPSTRRQRQEEDYPDAKFERLEREDEQPDCLKMKLQSREEDCPDAKRERRDRGEEQPDCLEMKLQSREEDCPEAKRERRERREEEDEDPADSPAALQEKRRRERRSRRDDQKAVRTVLVLVLCFALCWVPVLAVLLLQALAAAPLLPRRVLTGCQWLGYVNSLLNPLLHYKYNRSVRRAVRVALRLPPAQEGSRPGSSG